jgi:hypothetical protein
MKTSNVLLIIPDDGFHYLAIPQFGRCPHPAKHRILYVGGALRCCGCDKVCVAPFPVKMGDLVNTDSGTFQELQEAGLIEGGSQL